MTDRDTLFVGWAAQPPKPDRRFLLLASMGLIAAAGLGGAGMSQHGPRPGPGSWNQAHLERFTGVLIEDPYPMLLQKNGDGTLRPMLLASYDKLALPRLHRAPMTISIEASAIRRGDNIMLAVQNRASWSHLEGVPAQFTPVIEDLGPALRYGEILDAKCWFGAMNPGYGLTHKACAALCAQGGLPLAFCPNGECQAGEDVCLFLDEAGQPHAPAIIPFLADAVFADGRLVRRNGLLEFRAPLNKIRRA